MILKQGYSRKTIGENVARERKAGRPRNQAVAMAMETAREAARKAGKKMPYPKKKTGSKRGYSRPKATYSHGKRY